MKGEVRVLAENLFNEIENISNRDIPPLGICLHDRFSALLCAPLPFWFLCCHDMEKWAAIIEA